MIRHSVIEESSLNLKQSILLFYHLNQRDLFACLNTEIPQERQRKCKTRKAYMINVEYSKKQFIKKTVSEKPCSTIFWKLPTTQRWDKDRDTKPGPAHTLVDITVSVSESFNSFAFFPGHCPQPRAVDHSRGRKWEKWGENRWVLRPRPVTRPC